VFGVMNIKGWTTQTLRDLATINYGKSPAEILSSEGYYPVVGTGGTDRLGTDFLYEGDSIILGRKGTINRVYFTTGKFWIIDTAYYLNEFIEAYPLWLFYFLQTIDLRQMNEATGVPSLSRDALYKITVQTPSLKEQEKIANILATIDLAITQTEAIIAKQQRIKTGLMQDLLTKGIDENGNIRSEATHEFKDSSIGHIPVEWDVSPVSKYGSKHKSYLCTGPFGSTLNTKHWVQDGVPVLTIGSLGEGELIENELLYVTKLTARNLKSFVVEPSDIVFSRVADIGRSLVIEPEQEGSIISSNLMRLSVNKKKASPVYLHRNIAFNTSIVSQLRVTSNSGGRDLVNGEILSKILFPWPSFEEQNRINYVLDRIDKTISILKQELVNQNQIKIGLMQDLLTGKVRVTPLLEQEPANR
jgi:type I restriction enzyme, S subunit